jgi:hypothetical protein
MPTPTYVALATVTLTGSDSEVVFASIPQDYRDLRLVFVAAGSGDENLTPKINGSSSNFSWVQMTSAPGSGSGTNNSIGRVSTSQTLGVLEFLDYSATDKNKTFFVRTNVTGSEVRQLAACWAQTTAITTVSVSIRTGHSFNSGGYFALYGIEA